MSQLITLSVPKEKLVKAAAIMKLVAHPTRLAVVDLLGRYDRLTVNEIADATGCEQSLLSHHLTNMRLSGLLKSEREGVNIFYSLKLKELSKLLACIENCECNL
ncbi:MAG: metalloregulator ArsR/SmtB family transcription factor [Cytophagales bacterium]|nr:metalloregulator ArsR/SmtB family transcription factor [Cytophagales bacterium]MDW8385119.1 metalloregulator ArsR/SmtB family transcription factor [Flammeovirgaceae bacterium]